MAGARAVLRDMLLPLLGVMGVTAVLVALFYLCLHLGEEMTPIIEPHHDDGELVDPNPMRLVFMAVAFVASFLFALWADRMGKKKGEMRKGKVGAYPRVRPERGKWKVGSCCPPSRGAVRRTEGSSFLIAYAGGTLLWQSVGECAWHFSIPNEDYIMCLPHIEGASSVLLVIVTTILLVYCYRRHAFSWPVWIYVLSFVGNWFGHFVQIGTYPLVSSLMEEGEWFMLVGAVVGGLACWAALWMGAHMAQTRKARLCCCLMLYFGIGIITTGVAGI